MFFRCLWVCVCVSESVRSPDPGPLSQPPPAPQIESISISGPLSQKSPLSSDSHAYRVPTPQKHAQMSGLPCARVRHRARAFDVSNLVEFQTLTLARRGSEVGESSPDAAV